MPADNISSPSIKAANSAPTHGVLAGELHPSTPVITVTLHNQIVTSAQKVLDVFYEDAKKVPVKILVALVIGVVVGFLVASL